MSDLILYSYFRSSAAYRVRLALNIKELDYEYRYINLREVNSEQRITYKKVNPQGLVPALIHGQAVITQSLAIIEYLEQVYNSPSLLSDDAVECAYIRSLAQLIACDMHPLNNVRVLRYLENNLQQTSQDIANWYQHWVASGFDAFERHLHESDKAGPYCFGDHLSLADVCLIPQVYNALRFDCEMAPYSAIMSIYNKCLCLPAFQKAAPENQADSTL